MRPTSLATACKTVIDWTIFTDLNVLSNLTMPVCIIAWPDDNLHPFSLAQRMADIFPDARLETIPTLPFVFLQPQRIGEIYGAFLDGLVTDKDDVVRIACFINHRS